MKTIRFKRRTAVCEQIRRAAILACVAALSLLVDVGCGGAGGSATQPPTPTLTMSVSPSAANAFPGGSIVFAASVNGITTAVNWSVQEANGGTITSAGVYTAPASIAANPSTFHVVAASPTDPSRQITATVVVKMPSLGPGGVSPQNANVLVDGAVGFQAPGFDFGTGWTWRWSVKEGSAGGTIVADASDVSRATYRAPSSAGTFHIVLYGATVATNNYGEPLQEVDAGATVTVLSAAGPSSFLSTGSMSTPRVGHTATLLQDGRVLITGGASSLLAGASPLATAEIYDASTGTFTPTAANMSHGRQGHSATLLPNGRVLITGGSQAGACCDQTAELYDAPTDRFLPTGSMSLSPAEAVVTLPDDRVLFLGGMRPNGGPTAQVYNPASGDFTTAGSGEALAGLQAVLLHNGTILIAQSAISRSSAYFFETFDPASGTYRLTSTSLSPYMSDGTSMTVLHDGRVLVAGGGDYSDVYANQTIAGIYDPAITTITRTGDMKTVRGSSFTATLLADGTVLFVGGRFLDWNANAEIYNPVSGTFSAAGSMAQGRFGHTATLLANGRLLVVGGQVGAGPNGFVLATVELYVPPSSSLAGAHR